MSDAFLHTVQNMQALADKLATVESIDSLSDEEHNEPWSLAHDLSDIEESCAKLVNVYIKKLALEPLSSGAIEETLWDIGDEFRHLMYHMTNSKYFNYLINDQKKE